MSLTCWPIGDCASERMKPDSAVCSSGRVGRVSAAEVTLRRLEERRRRGSKTVSASRRSENRTGFPVFLLRKPTRIPAGRSAQQPSSNTAVGWLYLKAHTFVEIPSHFSHQKPLRDYQQ